jgi:DNA polymerase II large subunit
MSSSNFGSYQHLTARQPATATSGFSCLECGHKFKTVKAAERASFGPNGCPKCGGSDIDLTPASGSVSP